MSQQNVNTDRERATAEARAELLCEAEREGFRPLSFDELLAEADAGDPEKEDVEDFLSLRREWQVMRESRPWP